MQKIKERLIKRASIAQMPIMSAFELLPLCNLKCKMCYVRKSVDEVQKNGGIKDADWWLQVAKDAADCGLLYPLLTGGEPFLHPEFAKILEGMLKLGLQVSINTNGTLIDEEWAKFLSKNCPIRINLTLYGASEVAYEKLCGNGAAYEKVRKAVALLKKYKIPLKFNASITPENVQDLEKMVIYAKEQNVPIQVVSYMFPPVRRDSKLVGKNDRLSPEQAAYVKVLAERMQNDRKWFLAQATRYESFVPLEQEPWKKEKSETAGMRCRAGLCSLWVDWQGNFTNCGMYGSVTISMSGKTFLQAWKEVTEQTKKVRYTSECLLCPNKMLCHPCIAMIYNECGAHQGRPEYVCKMNQAIADIYRDFLENDDWEKNTDIVVPEKKWDDYCVL